MAAILGMRGTGSWDSTNIRPTNFRDKILFLYPDSPSILTMITGRLKSEATDDPKFTIFEKGLPVHRFNVDGAHADSDTDIALDDSVYGDPQDFIPIGSVIMCERTLEVMWVTDNTTADQITVARGKGSVPAAALTTNDYLLIIGSHHAEGANVPEAVSINPTERYNYTQIFRTSLNLTGTAKETYIRTGDIEKELKREAAERHALLMEWAFIFGQRTTNSSATPRDRTTGGILEYINGAGDDTNTVDFSGSLTKSAWEGFLEDIFEVPGGSQEKLLLCGNKALTALNAMAQAYGEINLTPTSSTYGMKFMEYQTPYGALQVKQHPLMSQNPVFNDWGIVIDTRNVVYRFLRNRDTKFLKDRQSPGQDQVIHEFLTECGLEFRHPKTHGYFKNCTAFTP